jgi:hypothetical protein
VSAYRSGTAGYDAPIMPDDRPVSDLHGPDAGAGDQPSRPLKSTFGTAVGAAMLGFEQAIRSEPPAEVIAAEHAPELGQSGEDDGMVIIITEPLPR